LFFHSFPGDFPMGFSHDPSSRFLQVVWITGASGGFGEARAKRLAQDAPLGWRLGWKNPGILGDFPVVN
jgi:hypothetical protein